MQRSTRRFVPWLLLAGTVALSCKSASPANPPTFQTVDRGAGRCVAINTAGDVVGAIDEQGAFLASRDGTRTSLGVLESDALTMPLGITESGVVVGYSEGPTGRRAATWANGAWSQVYALSQWDWSIATAVRDDTIVGVGVSDPPTDPTTAPDTLPVRRAFLVSPDSLTILNSNGDDTLASAVASGGYVAGSLQTQTGETHAFVFQTGTVTDLGTLGGANSNAYAVNSHGDVVGVSELSPDGPGHAFLYTAGTMQDLGTLGGDASDARGIDESGIVVGNSYTADGSVHPFAFVDGKMLDLLPNDSDGHPFLSARAEAITASGRQVVGWGTPKESPDDGPVRCIVWTLAH
jgi:probable HAF family extracellular repeat protein